MAVAAPPGSQLAKFGQNDFSAGSNQDVASFLIDARGFFDCENGLLDDDGSVYMRGGSTAHSNAGFATGGREIFDGFFQNLQRTFFSATGAFGVLGADDATPLSLGGAGKAKPDSLKLIEDLLFVGGGPIYGGSRKTANYSTGTVALTAAGKTVTGTGTAFLANVDVGMLFRVSGERAYPVASVDSDTQITLRDPYEGSTASGVAYTLKPLESATSPYRSSSIYCVVADRLLLAENGKTVRFSAIHKPHIFTETIAGVSVDNKHDLDEGVQILGMESLGQSAFVFTTQGVYLFSNMAQPIVDPAGNQLHRIDQISRDLILWGNAGISSWRGGLVVPALDGVYLVYGAGQPVRISNGYNKPYREHIKLGHVPGQAAVFREHYFLPILDASGAYVTTFVCRLDRPVGSRGQESWPWTFHSGAGAACAALTTRPPISGGPYRLLGAEAAGTKKILDLGSFFTPSVAVKLDHDGSVPPWSLTTRDWGDGKIGRVRKVRILYELQVDGTDSCFIFCDIGGGVPGLAQPKWDEVKWDEFQWADDLGFSGTLSAPTPGAPPNPPPLNENAFTWYAATRARYPRFRLRTTGPAAKLTIRAIEVWIAQATDRISKVA